MIGITGIATHWDTCELAHKVIFESRALDLARVVEIFRANKANQRIDLVRMPAFCQPIVARFECELIPAIVSISRKRGTLTGFKVHEVRTFRETIFFRHLISFIEHAYRNSERVVSFLRTSNGLEDQSNW